MAMLQKPVPKYPSTTPPLNLAGRRRAWVPSVGSFRVSSTVFTTTKYYKLVCSRVLVSKSATRRFQPFLYCRSELAQNGPLPAPNVAIPVRPAGTRWERDVLGFLWMARTPSWITFISLTFALTSAEGPGVLSAVAMVFALTIGNGPGVQSARLKPRRKMHRNCSKTSRLYSQKWMKEQNQGNLMKPSFSTGFPVK